MVSDKYSKSICVSNDPLREWLASQLYLNPEMTVASARRPIKKSSLLEHTVLLAYMLHAELSRRLHEGRDIMNVLSLVFGFLSAVSVFAATDGIYFTSSPSNVNPSAAQSSAYVLEVKSFFRNAETDPWSSIGNVTLCFSVQTKPDCYHSVANFLGLASIPKKPGDPIAYTNYTYGLDFGYPTDGKVQVTTLQSIKRKVGSDEDWNDVSPAFTRSGMAIDVGSWASTEFREAKDLMKKIEVRIIEQPR